MPLAKKIKDLAKKYHQDVVKWRQHLHATPELSFQEFETSKFIQQVLKNHHISFSTMAKTGVVALIKGTNADKKCIALRGDIDALPIIEQNSFAYKSKNEGIMHACGHDFHTSSLLGTALILNELKSEFEGTFKIIFQPSEEKIPSGAPAMIAEGVLENPKVDYIIGQHVSPELKTGTFGFKAGKFMASADEIYMTIKGKGGHAARPHETIDSVLTASQIIVNLQQVVSRKTNPFDTIVLSFGKIEGKGATNVLPDEVKIEGTLRAMNETLRFEAHKWIKEIAQNTAKASGASCDVNIVVGYPCVENNEEFTHKLIFEANNYLGKENVIDIPQRMGAEDFGYYSQKVPSCFYRVGTGNENKKTTFGLHTSHFNVDDDALQHSIGLMAWLAINS
ncbi:MAG: amidohydrolase [Chitinophagales bacterium]|nr:amidohydrolase [Chitinophagales bacterium]